MFVVGTGKKVGGFDLMKKTRVLLHLKRLGTKFLYKINKRHHKVYQLSAFIVSHRNKNNFSGYKLLPSFTELTCVIYISCSPSSNETKALLHKMIHWDFSLTNKYLSFHTRRAPRAGLCVYSALSLNIKVIFLKVVP